MKYLLDTSVWMRSALNAETLPGSIRKIVGDPGESLGLCIFSLWEAATKHEKGRLPLPMELTAWIKSALTDNVRVLPLTMDTIVDSVRLPDFPVNDPADQLIVATARVHKLTLLTTDTKLKAYRHARIHYFRPVEVNA